MNNKIYLILLITIFSLILPAGALTINFENGTNDFKTSESGPFVMNRSTSIVHSGAYSFILPSGYHPYTNISLSTNTTVRFWAYLPSTSGENTFTAYLFDGANYQAINAGYPTAGQFGFNNGAWQSNGNNYPKDVWFKTEFRYVNGFSSIYVNDVKVYDIFAGTASSVLSRLSFYSGAVQYIDDIEIIDNNAPIPLDIGGVWNVEVTTDNIDAFITACVGNSGGYYKLKSASGTILRSSNLTNNGCMSSTEDKAYLYSLEPSNWIAYVTLPNGTVMAFDAFDVSPAPTPTPTPTPSPTPSPTPTPNPTGIVSFYVTQVDATIKITQGETKQVNLYPTNVSCSNQEFIISKSGYYSYRDKCFSTSYHISLTPTGLGKAYIGDIIDPYIWIQGITTQANGSKQAIIAVKRDLSFPEYDVQYTFNEHSINRLPMAEITGYYNVSDKYFNISTIGSNYIVFTMANTEICDPNANKASYLCDGSNLPNNPTNPGQPPNGYNPMQDKTDDLLSTGFFAGFIILMAFAGAGALIGGAIGATLGFTSGMVFASYYGFVPMWGLFLFAIVGITAFSVMFGDKLTGGSGD